MRYFERLYPEQYSQRWQYNFAAVLYVLAFVSLALIVVFAIQFVQSRSDARDSIQLDVWEKAEKAKAAVDARFAHVQEAISLIAAEADAARTGAFSADGDIFKLMREDPSIRNAGFFEQADSDTESPKLVAYRRSSDRRGDFDPRRSEEDVAVASVSGGRFQIHFDHAASGAPGWAAAIDDEEAGVTVVPFVYPVRFGDETGPTSFVFAEISLGGLNQVIEWTSLGEAGFNLLLDNAGRITEHPDDELVAQRADFSAASGISADRIEELRGNSPDTGISLAFYSNEVDGNDSLLTLHTLPTADWTLGYIALESQVLTRSEETKQALMQLVAAAVAFLFVMLIVVTRSYAGSLGGLWLLALSTGLLFTAGILVIWYLFATTPASTEPTRVDLADAIQAHKEYLTSNFDEESIDVEVGIALTSVDFTKLGSTIANADEAIISGFIWSNCFDCLLKGRDIGLGDEGRFSPVEPGFFFPEAREVETELVLNFQEGKDRTNVFRFTAIVSRDFQPDRYPFDTDNVSLRIWSQDFDLPTLLIPDIADYRSLVQTDKPGLATDFNIAGWNTEGTFYSYDVVNYNTTFGMQREIGTTNSTELLFNIAVRRNFINAFITNILPIVVIMVLLFHVLLITPKTEKYILAFAGGSKSEGAAGTGSPTYTLIATSMVLAYTSALFFAVILAHSRLRNEIPADGILYLEYFYFAAYFAILAVTMNVLGFAAHRGGWIIHYRDNLIPRIAYWPLVTLFLFAVTFVTFY